MDKLIMNKPVVQQMFIGKAIQFVDRKAARESTNRSWTTAIFKTLAEGTLWLGKTGLNGDEVGDTVNHGGPEKALFAYPVSHYAFWQKALNRNSIDIGGMGENLAVLAMDESTVCIGDTYSFGDAVIQVSQPRRPCWKPANRHGVPDLALQIQGTGRTGWYFRVLREGGVRSGLELERLDRPYPQWTISTCNEAMYNKEAGHLARELAKCELLSDSWRLTLNNRMNKQEPADADDKRIFGQS